MASDPTPRFSDIQHAGRRRAASTADRLLRPVFALWRKLRPEPDVSDALRHPRRILVVQLDHIGDTIMALPVFSALRSAHPQAQITALVGPWSSDLLKHNRAIDQVIIHATPWFANARGAGRMQAMLRYLRYLPAYLRLARRLRRDGYDLAFDLRGDFRHILLYLWLGGCRARVSSTRTGGAYLLSQAVPHSPDSHIVRRNLSLLEACGLDPALSFQVNTSAADEASAQRKLVARGIDWASFVVMHPGARTQVRRWPPERFAQVIDWLFETHGLPVVIVGSADERDIGCAIAAHTQHPPALLSGELSLLETASLLKQASLFVGNESAVMHMAAACGTPVVALYGPMDPAQTRPLTPNTTVLFERFPCCPCRQDRCLVWPRSYGKCLDAISVEAVQQAAEAALRSNASTAGAENDGSGEPARAGRVDA